MRRVGGLGAALAAAQLAACANELPPPGALPDRLPPEVARIVPGRDTIVPGFDSDATIRFTEPVRAQGLERTLSASPAEAYEVKVGFSDVRMKPRDGWRDGVVYCLELPSGISDLLNNRTETAIDFCFSTGPRIADTRVTGRVIDALTGSPQPGARVLFLALPEDSTPYSALTDSEGQFRLRALPPRSYEAFGFLDRNRNFALDRVLEPNDSVRFVLPDSGRLELAFRLVEPDTTPPVLLRAEAVDSLTVQLEFDDALLREQPSTPRVTVSDSLTGRALEILGVAVGEPSTVQLPGLEPEEPAEEEEPEPEAAPPPPGDPTAPQEPAAEELPSRVVTIRLADALVPASYRVRAEGFVNLRSLSGGGDTTFVYDPTEEEEEEEEESELPPGDTLRPDTVAADTVRADTLRADTLRADTVRADTVRADTTRSDTVGIAGRRVARHPSGAVASATGKGAARPRAEARARRSRPR